MGLQPCGISRGDDKGRPDGRSGRATPRRGAVTTGAEMVLEVPLSTQPMEAEPVDELPKGVTAELRRPMRPGREQGRDRHATEAFDRWYGFHRQCSGRKEPLVVGAQA
jgi:hypothetical protein